MKAYPLASKKGMPRVILHGNNISCYDAEEITEMYDLARIRTIQHHRRKLYGKGHGQNRIVIKAKRKEYGINQQASE